MFSQVLNTTENVSFKVTRRSRIVTQTDRCPLPARADRILWTPSFHWSQIPQKQAPPAPFSNSCCLDPRADEHTPPAGRWYLFFDTGGSESDRTAPVLMHRPCVTLTSAVGAPVCVPVVVSHSGEWVSRFPSLGVFLVLYKKKFIPSDLRLCA